MATVDRLVQLKKLWGVSVAALTYRMHVLGVLSDWHYQSLFVEISKRGFRRSEPNEGQRETSQVLQKVFVSLREDGISHQDVAAELSVAVEELTQLIFGLTLTALVGRSVGVGTRKRAKLRLVQS
jgi:fructose-1,6-bisphosphatase/inositol monophosphatase family enzyme